MQVKDIFVKDINRSMNPVIKVSDQDDEETIFQELDEYVVTQEIDKNFEKLYRGITDGMKEKKDHIGVWISGDFGSGKSHFLKITSFLLKNQAICGKDSIDYLKNKVSESVFPMMQAVGRRNIDTILFDIDAKSRDGQSADSLVQTFALVFNEMLGLSSEMAVANFERHLISIGAYDSFKDSYKQVSKGQKTWEEDRHKPAFIKGGVTKALVACGAYDNEDEAARVAASISSKASISAEEFATMVGDHCRSKGSDYSLFFLVDEVGQFISGDVQRMLKLQTIVQELGVRANGQAWCIVTSQEDIDSIVSGVSNNDFSKIQGRFSTRIKMVSSDVKEVIEKRVLEKTYDAKVFLEAYFEGNSADIGNKLSMKNTKEIRLYRDKREFANTYPFIPYQYDMLQVMLTQLRDKSNAGKNLSNAARSMLKIFKDTAAANCNEGLDFVVPMHAFYDSIRDELDSPTGLVFNRAVENDQLNDFDVDVLKTLYLVKYYPAFATNLDNIAAMMVSSFDQDRLRLKAEIEQSLNRLIEQNFVQRSGDVYYYLTNEEQSVNREIQRETIDESSLYQQISQVAFGQIFGISGKYRYDSNHDYQFNKYVDDENIGNTEHELTLRISTPRDKTPEVLMAPRSENGVIFDIPDDKRTLEAFAEYIKTDNYIRKKSGTQIPPAEREVLDKKRVELPAMKERAKSQLSAALQDAKVYVNGNEMDISSNMTPEARMKDGMNRLIQSVYSKMGYVKGTRTTKTIEDLFKLGTVTPFDDSVKDIRLAVDEVSKHLAECDASRMTVLVKNVMEKFGRKPYGFGDVDIQWILALMFRHGRIDLFYDGMEYRGNSTKPQMIPDLLLKSRNYDKVKVIVREAVTAEQISRAKDVYDSIFRKTFQLDENLIVSSVNKDASEQLKAIDTLMENYRVTPQYPGKDVLLEIREVMERLSKLQSSEFYKYTDQNEPSLRSIPGRFDDIKDFFAPDSRRKNLYDRGIAAIRDYESNVDFLGQDAKVIAEEIGTIIDGKDSKLIPNLNVLCTQLDSKIDDAVGGYRGKMVSELECKISETSAVFEDHPALCEEFRGMYSGILQRINDATSINDIITACKGYDFQVERLKDRIPAPAPATPPVSERGDSPGGAPVPETHPEPEDVPHVPKPRAKISIGSVSSNRRAIDSEDDINEIVEDLRRNLKARLSNGPFDIIW
ncbi:BREX system P-loop protein BrxC [Candidatus Methanoprimaticola sp. MG2]|uniref:BREX system P-loop protein BrxC n=1 Tax=Candidatus Methanoprimaticola sp. MG2 TaxID=3228838 RepID=UPI0039C657AE